MSDEDELADKSVESSVETENDDISIGDINHQLEDLLRQAQDMMLEDEGQD